MSTDLTVQTELVQTPQPIVDQEGTQSSLFLGSASGIPEGQAGFVGILGPGGFHSSAALTLSTYSDLSLVPNGQIQVVDQGDYAATMSFNLLPPGTSGQGATRTILQLLPEGGVKMPLLQQPSGGTVDLVIDGDGNVSPQNSSARFKEDIAPLQDDFHKVLLLEPRSFSYKDTGARGIGYTAEEVAEADLDNLVAYDAEGRPLGVHYKMLSVYLLELVKEQRVALAEVQAALAEVQAEVAALKGLPS